MAFDATILNLIMAPDKPAAIEALDQGQPNAFIETIGAAVERTQLVSEADSSTSVTVGTGSKVFTLDQPRSWRDGLPVYIRSKGNPANFMAGILTGDESPTGDITVDVLYTGGSGTLSDWSVSAILAVTTVASTPVAIADGGTGADNPPVARFALGARFSVVEGPLSTPPGAPVTNKLYLVGNLPTGAWSGYAEDSYARHNGSSWSEILSVHGDLVAIIDASATLLGAALKTPAAVTKAKGGVTDTSKFRYVQSVGFNQARLTATPAALTSAKTFQPTDMFQIWEVDASSGQIDLTLANHADSRGSALTVVKVDGSSNPVVITPEAGGLINGQSAYTLRNAHQVVVLRARHSSPLNWYVVGESNPAVSLGVRAPVYLENTSVSTVWDLTSPAFDQSLFGTFETQLTANPTVDQAEVLLPTGLPQGYTFVVKNMHATNNLVIRPQTGLIEGSATSSVPAGNAQVLRLDKRASNEYAVVGHYP